MMNLCDRILEQDIPLRRWIGLVIRCKSIRILHSRIGLDVFRGAQEMVKKRLFLGASYAVHFKTLH
jgi:hypothetical protein